MRTLVKATVIASTLLLSGAAFAQVSAQVTVAVPPPPTVTFEVAPPLVYVSPGVQVVEGYDEEVFFTGGWYWCRRDGVWFRTHDYHGGWVMAPRRYVPARIYRMPPGHYRNYHYAGGPGRPVHYARPAGYHGGGYGRPVGHEYARPVGHGGGHEFRGGGGGHGGAAPAMRGPIVHGGGGHGHR